MNILNYILSFIIVGLLNTEYPYPVKQNSAENSHRSIICKYYRNPGYTLKSANSNLDLTILNYSYLEFDQDDNDNSNHNKNLSICILNSEESKIFTLREKEFIPKKSSLYFELDLPPPLIS